jgi:phosphatidylserine/phosphatidylglycerophosphate/cardiolipin synthase-like enzyme
MTCWIRFLPSPAPRLAVAKAALGAALLLIGCVGNSAASEPRVCFTPGQNCTAQIVSAIDRAKSELLMQAYLFTSPSIMKALVRAKRRGVAVKVLLDKVNEQKPKTAATFLKDNGIDPLIDDSVSTAHNKVIVLDRRDTITGSFNFTKAAQNKNAENVLIVVNNRAIARAYARNWQRRAERSRPFSGYRPGPTPACN